MRRMRHWAGGARLPLYKWIIGRYAPYVLVRCARFTNSRCAAQEMGVYTLITTCLLAHQLRHPEQLASLVDTMVDVIGPDVVLRGPATVPRHGGEEPLIADPRMRELADALNLLPRFAREALVLRHIAGTKIEDRAKTPCRLRRGSAARVSRAEGLLAGCLAGARPDGGPPDRAQVHSLLAQFAAGIDFVWLQAVQDYTLHYLSRRHEPDHQPQGCWYLN